MAKTSPNDRCPCGSGKKYKRCCLEVDRAAASAAATNVAPSPELELARLTESLGRGDMKALAGSLELVTPLLETGGPLESIRFDPSSFEEAFVRNIEKASDLDDEARRRDILRACIRAACDARGAQSLIRRMTAICRSGKVPAAAEGALSFWLSATEAALETGGNLPLESPLLVAIAGVQADELTESRYRASVKLGSLAQGLRDGTMSLSEVERELEEHGDGLATLFETTPGLAEVADSAAAKARAEIPRLLQGRNALRVLGLDEYLLLTMEAHRLRTDHRDDAEFHRALGVHLRDHPLVSLVLARLRLASKDSKLSSAKRDRFFKAALLLGMDPPLFFLTALKEDSFEESIGEMACMERAGSEVEAIEALAAHYEGMGLTDRAARARKAAVIARSLPSADSKR